MMPHFLRGTRVLLFQTLFDAYVACRHCCM
jgi:hypothetical protein